MGRIRCSTVAVAAPAAGQAGGGDAAAEEKSEFELHLQVLVKK